jgi:exosortase
MNTTGLQTAGMPLTFGEDARRWLALRAIAAIGLTLLTFASLWPAMFALLTLWQDTERRTYTHGHVVVAIGLWLLWRDRGRWAQGATNPSLPGLALLACGALLWLTAWRAGLQIITVTLVPAMAAAAFLTVFGWKALRQCWFAFAFLFLAVPIWDAFLPVLNLISVYAVRLLVRIADVPAYFVNNSFQIPGGVFEIADGCSGLHFFVVALTVSLLYGEVTRDPLRTRVKLVALALLLAMATNWLRIFIIVLAGYFTDMQHSLVTNEHYSFGWYMFAGMMVLYFLIVRRWPAPAELPAGPSEASGPVLSRNGLAFAAMGLLITPAWVLLDANRADPARLESAVPEQIRSAPAASLGQWQPHFPGHDGEWRASTTVEGADIELFAVAFAEQRQDKELTGHATSILGPSLTRRNMAAGPDSWLELQAADSNGDAWLVWYTYRIDSTGYRSAMRMQLSYGLRSLFDAPASSLLALRTRCDADSCARARTTLNSFVGTLHP